MNVRARADTRMLTVGDALPELSRRVAAGPDAGREVALARFRRRWLVLLYWPVDFAFLGTAEIEEFGRRHEAFAARGAQVLGAGEELASLEKASLDLRRLPFPLLDDSDRDLARALGLLPRGDRCALRATFVADAARVIRWVRASDLWAERGLAEVLRALDALRARDLPGGLPAATEEGPSESLITMCAWCRRVRDGNAWTDVEDFVRRRTGGDLTHGICPDCLRRHGPAPRTEE